MPAIVTLDIYSGRPNPTWELSSDQLAEYRELLASARVYTPLQSPASAMGLGYRGFTVQSVADISIPHTSLFFGGVMDIGDVRTRNFSDTDNRVERFLLSTGTGKIPERLHAYVRDQIERNALGALEERQAVMVPLIAPRYNPAKWNNNPVIRENNNCYNYANDKFTKMPALPGLGSGHPVPLVPSCEATGAAAISDGQIPLGADFDITQPCPEGQWIALFVWTVTGEDFHWYRCDSNGMWSQKPGTGDATNLDNKGRLISDPRTCDYSPYTEFCQFFQCIPANTHIA
jgi:hypothetical protein